ncbi:HK97 family phage prohead protease [Cupriavidus gilardii]|uniref:HK97 family phage prohead protease n=1 Tax=Cupriavidus gilardii TaxID=82541 RepID=A0ABY4VSE4_9BURK|nr:HK97 family phage prohead protease [Cupriavidus gilardii]USE78914.1 HK97 family phage prohead protease [Cupriavidus gilardii]
MNRKDASLKIRDFDLNVKAVSDDGLFSGYGSVFGVVDSYREVVAPGAFADSLAEIKAKGRPVPVLWQHRSGEPIGVYDALSEDGHGLKVDGRLILEVSRAKEAHALMKAGAVSGLSIGYYVREDSWDEKERVRTLKKLDLVEVSLVTFPANDDARVDAIKSKLAHGSLPTLSEFEQLLREAGFSKSQAAVIANRGLKHLLDRSESGSVSADIDALIKQIGGGLTFHN